LLRHGFKLTCRMERRNRMKILLTTTLLIVAVSAGTANAAWQQRAVFFPDGLASHSWTTTTYTLPGCSSTSVILQKAKAPGTVVQLLYNPSTNTTCQAATYGYLDKMLNDNPVTGTVDFR
jgi:hypothetical protein